MVHIGSYQVSVKTLDAEKMALLTLASANDMPTNWSFPRSEFYQAASREGQKIIKLVVEEQVWGLVQYGVYPMPCLRGLSCPHHSL